MLHQSLRKVSPFIWPTLLLLASVTLGFGQARPEYDKKSDPKVNRREGLAILETINDIVGRYYFDPSFKGINLKERYSAAQDLIKKQEFRWQINRTIAQFLLDLNDSHTIYYPPDRLFRVEYGFSMMMIGNSCFVTDVKKGSDAEKRGLKAGDRIDNFNGLVLDRGNFGPVNYLIYTLDPQEILKLEVAGADGKKKAVEVKARFLSPEERKQERQKRRKDEESKPYKCQAIDSEVIACKLRTFVIEKEVIDKMMKEVAGYKKLILDLRGNGGGYVKTESHLTAYFFDRKIKIGTEVGRSGQKERFTEVRKDPFLGELFVIIDSQSASASEVFARTMQIEKRGKVVGDTSMGAVMTSNGAVISLDAGTASIDFVAVRNFGINVTVGDLIMSDGNRLEGLGVSPDHPVGPTPTALADRNDPVLAFAVELAGSRISPEKAGGLNFFMPKAEEESDKEAEEGKDK